MRTDLSTVLDDCLHQMKRGQADVETCLARFPQHADQLRALLETASRLQRAAIPEPRAASVLRGEQLLVAAVEQRRGNSRHELVKANARGGSSLGRLVSRLRLPKLQEMQVRAFPLSSRLGAAVAAVVLLFSLSVGAVAASAESLPGQPLYPVKRTVEKVRLALSLSDGTKTELQIAFAGRRIQEISEVTRRGQDDKVAGLVSDLGGHLKGANLGAEPASLKVVESDPSVQEHQFLIESGFTTSIEPRKPAPKQTKIEIDGTVQAVAEARIVIGGLTVVVDEQTNSNAAPVIGASAQVVASARPDGSFLAETIEVGPGDSDDKDDDDRVEVPAPQPTPTALPPAPTPEPTPTAPPAEPTPAASPVPASPSPWYVSGVYPGENDGNDDRDDDDRPVPTPVPTELPPAPTATASPPTPVPTATPVPASPTLVPSGNEPDGDADEDDDEEKPVPFATPASPPASTPTPSPEPTPTPFVTPLPASPTAVPTPQDTTEEGEREGDLDREGTSENRQETRIEGVVQDLAPGEWFVVGGQKVLLNDHTEIDGSLGVGVGCEVEAVVLDDGTLVATEVEVEKGVAVPTPGPTPTPVPDPTETPTPVPSRDGPAVFSTYCSACHGADGQGGPAENIAGTSPSELRDVVRSGEDSMPAFGASQISDTELEDLARYIAGLP